MYALNLAPDNRILSATFAEFAAPGQPIVDALPEGNIADWKYIDDRYVYDPLPAPVVVLTADTNIQKGKYFTAGDAMYMSTAVILAGDPIKPGTNCVKKSMSEALNAINL